MKSEIKDEKIKQLERDLYYSKLDIKKLHRHIYVQNKALAKSHAQNLIPLKQRIKERIWDYIEKYLMPFPKIYTYIAQVKKDYEDGKKKAMPSLQERWIKEDIEHSNNFNPNHLIFISPLPPSKSGIADYSIALLKYLKTYYDITVVCENIEVQNHPMLKEYKTVLAQEYLTNGSIANKHLYHYGNSVYHVWMEPLLERFPGTLVLHDIFLGGYMRMKLQSEGDTIIVQKMFDEEGYKAIVSYMETDLHHALSRYPMNKALIEKSDSIIVHSAFAKSLLDAPESKVYQIPHLKALPTQIMTKNEARKILGIDESSFLIASFGFIGASKCSHELVKAWKQLTALPKNVKLVFVGGVPSSPYGKTIKELADGTNILFTDYCDDEAFIHYLVASDMVVQLRQNSRGESSGALLYALAYGKPTIINAHGSFCEIPHDVAMSISDDFSLSELSQAIKRLYEDEKLREKLTLEAKHYIASTYDPNQCAKMYFDAIEESYERGRFSAYRKALLEKTFSLEELINKRTKRLKNSLYVDVSDVANHDLRTGIQRVVRSVLHYMLHDNILTYRIEPVRLVDGAYIHAHEFTCHFLGLPFSPLPDEPIRVKDGDIFLGLDHYIAQIGAHPQLFEEMSHKGVTIWFVMYDILPVTFPYYFPPTSEPLFKRWLSVIATYAKGVVCISETVQYEFSQWLQKEHVERSLDIAVFPLGADIDNSHPTWGITSEENELLHRLENENIVLMVGTIEPRKGHQDILNAFECLWEENETMALVIVGKKGWMVEACIENIKRSSWYGKKLFWLDKASDELLEKIYKKATLLIAASYGEGFGLPIVEAVQRGVPVLARDIPVFREIGAESIAYFPCVSDTATLAKKIKTHTKKATIVKPINEFKFTSWEESTQKLLESINIKKPKLLVAKKV